jgi:Aldo/keto reductase family
MRLLLFWHIWPSSTHGPWGPSSIIEHRASKLALTSAKIAPLAIHSLDRDSMSLMKYRSLGRTGWKVSEISFGGWAIGGAWGSVRDEESLDALNAAIDSRVNFLDTADVYGSGRSERLIAQLKKSRKEEIIVATKGAFAASTGSGRRRMRSTSLMSSG